MIARRFMRILGSRPAAVLPLAICLTALSGQAAAEDPTWRPVDPDNLALMELQEGQVLIELNPAFAPQTVKQFRRLVRERFYDGLGFYRVIDGFVAQGGDGSDLGEMSDVPLVEAEFEREWTAEMPFVAAQRPDLFAPETGFIAGFAAGRDPRQERAWLLHCPGVVAMARNEDPDSSRTDFYIVIGQAPRYLDRNMNVFGRVIHGMEVVQRIRRGPVNDNGIIRDDTEASRIRGRGPSHRVRRRQRQPGIQRPADRAARAQAAVLPPPPPRGAGRLPGAPGGPRDPIARDPRRGVQCPGGHSRTFSRAAVGTVAAAPGPGGGQRIRIVPGPATNPTTAPGADFGRRPALGLPGHLRDARTRPD
jgi:peptidylprolyl isomerase